MFIHSFNQSFNQIYQRSIKYMYFEDAIMDPIEFLRSRAFQYGIRTAKETSGGDGLVAKSCPTLAAPWTI